MNQCSNGKEVQLMSEDCVWLRKGYEWNILYHINIDKSWDSTFHDQLSFMGYDAQYEWSPLESQVCFFCECFLLNESSSLISKLSAF